jgi:sec-independent protein translocase protein TatB
MFNIDWEEMTVIAVVALLVLGPKELPGLMRTAGQMVRKARLIAHDFRLSLDEMVEEAELKDVEEKAFRKAVEIEPAVKSSPPQLAERDAPQSAAPGEVRE